VHVRVPPSSPFIKPIADSFYFLYNGTHAKWINMKHKVLITQRFNAAQVERLRAVSNDVQVIQKPVSERWDSMDTGSLFDGTEEVLYGLVPPRDLAVAPALKWVQLHSAGINQLAAHPILESEITITTSSGIHAVPIGEFSIAMMMALARHVPRMVRLQDRGEWPQDRWRMFIGTEMHGKTLGIVGYGSIGRHVARIATQGLGMRVLAMTRSGNKADRGYHEPGVGDPDGRWPSAWFVRDQLADLLAQSDFVLLAVPLTSETRHLIGERELGTIKPEAYIVNIARGEVIDEAALIRALSENRIAGAGLDVFSQEPLPATSPLWHMENVLMAPHVSAATPSYDDRVVALFAENLRRYVQGEPLLNTVDKQLRY
jgi:phosphoglycerate dehydrogenase-like enzyme